MLHSHRLIALRDHMNQKQIDAYIVPHSDEYMSEYLAPYAERLKFLTGFSGSNGMAVILNHKAGFFTDGRYTLQASAEVDEQAYQIIHMGQTPPFEWLEQNLTSGMVIGFDPWLLTVTEVAQLNKMAQTHHASLKPIIPNLIDLIWPDQPAYPQEKIWDHPLEFAGSSRDKKLQMIAQFLDQAKQEAVLLTDLTSIAWLLNIRGQDMVYSPLALCFCLLYKNATGDLYIELDKVPLEIKQAFAQTIACRPASDLLTRLKELGQQPIHIRLDPKRTASIIATTLEGQKAVTVYGDDPCQLAKAIKNDTEIKGAIAAHRRDGGAVINFLAWLSRQGSFDEISASDRLEFYRQQQSLFHSLSFPTIAGLGAHGAIIHYCATLQSNKTAHQGDLFLLDSGAQYYDGTTDITRTIGINVTNIEAKYHYTLVLKGHIALSLAQFPKGTSGGQLDSLARQFLWQAGLDYDHGTGHGVGSFLSVHEGPQNISKRGFTTPLVPNMVVSNEPGYYKAEHYGIRLENLVRVVESKNSNFLAFEPLTLVPFDRTLILAEQLTPQEKNWLNLYHALVLEQTAAFIEPDAQTWVKAACAPLEG